LQSLFEGAAFAKRKPELAPTAGLAGEEIDISMAGGWGDDDLQFDDDNTGGEKDDVGADGEAGEFESGHRINANLRSYIL